MTSWLQAQHGRKQGLLRLALARANFLLTTPHNVTVPQNIHWQDVRRVIFICKGNICRSAYAEACLKNLGIESVKSFGTKATTGAVSSDQAKKAALLSGVDLNTHTATSLSEYQLQVGDLVLGFELSHIESIPATPGVLMSLVGLFHENYYPHIEDPYGLSLEYYETCFTRIDQSLLKIASLLKPLKKNILVVESDSMGALGVIRSLGRAGHNVHAVSQKQALSKHSSYATTFELVPSYNSAEYQSSLESIVKKNSIDFIIPSESFLLANKDHLDKWGPYLPIPKESIQTLNGMSKVELFRASKKAGLTKNLPKHLIVEMQTTEAEFKSIESFRYPIFFKGDSLYSKLTQASGKIIKCTSPEEMKSACLEMNREYSQYLVTEFVEGKGVGVFFLIWDGQIIADFMHLRTREVPFEGGVSSCRESFFDKNIYDDALIRLKSMNWQGVAMMEYRWNSTKNEFYLMEMNGRFWGSIHLALYSQVDFPKYLIECLSGKAAWALCESRLTKWRKKLVICRNFAPLELQNLWSIFKSKDKKSFEKIKHTLLWLKDTIDPTVYSDLGSFPSDRRLFFINFIGFFQATFDAIKSKRGKNEITEN